MQIARAGPLSRDHRRGRLAGAAASASSSEDGTATASTSDLREMCLFSAHNLMRDPPFSKLDLISCRNLLIYLDAGAAGPADPAVPLRAARRRLPVPGQLGERHAPFAAVRTVDKKHRIFQRRRRSSGALPEFPSDAPPARPPEPRPRRRAARRAGPLQSLADGSCSSAIAPAYVVITGDGELLHCSAPHRQVSRAASRRADASTSSAWRARPAARPARRRPQGAPAAAGRGPEERHGRHRRRPPDDRPHVHPLRADARAPDRALHGGLPGRRRHRAAREPRTLAGSADELESASSRQLETELRDDRERTCRRRPRSWRPPTRS